jgi:DNA-binding MarR family transcriptional regulator
VRAGSTRAGDSGAVTAAPGRDGHATADGTRADRPVAHDEHIDRAWLADELGATLVQISTVLRRAILPPQISLTQASTLLILRDEGPQRVTSLAEAAQVTQPTMSALVIGMERLGWVRRDASSTDRRAVAVCLTESGDQVVRELEAARNRALLADLGALTPRERAALVAALPALRGIIAHEQQSKNADKNADKAVAW